MYYFSFLREKFLTKIFVYSLLLYDRNVKKKIHFQLKLFALLNTYIDN
jgi:hypothetical protein